MLCKVIQHLLLSNSCCKAWLNIQKSVQTVVPKKSMKAYEGKDLTVGIRLDAIYLILEDSICSKEVAYLGQVGN